MDSTYFVYFNRLTLFFVNLRHKSEKLKQNPKIWKFKMAAVCDVIYLTIVTMETN